jgi:hypothetical protein
VTWWWCCGSENGKRPLRLAFQVREGLVLVMWVRKRKTAPPSRVSSEGGVGGGVVGKNTGKRPLRLAFQAREGSVVVVHGGGGAFGFV